MQTRVCQNQAPDVALYSAWRHDSFVISQNLAMFQGTCRMFCISSLSFHSGLPIWCVHLQCIVNLHYTFHFRLMSMASPLMAERSSVHCLLAPVCQFTICHLNSFLLLQKYFFT